MLALTTDSVGTVNKLFYNIDSYLHYNGTNLFYCECGRYDWNKDFFLIMF